ncbi:MAG: MFS transporter [Proteobacteria bacterium]|nr:MFS transporter [Pseudomonadota bacterium]
MTSHSAPARAAVLLILCGGAILFLSTGVRGAFGLFLKPVSTDLGWGREVFALAIAVQNLLWGASQPVFGAIADRFGSARVIVAGGLAYALGVLLMSAAEGPALFHLGAGVLVGIGLSGTSFGVVLAAIGRAVPDSRRSLALGVGTAMGSLGQFVMAPVGQAFLTAYGWSSALALLALTSLAMIPLAGALKGRPEEAHAGPAQTLAQALVEASRHSGYLMLVAGYFVCGFHVAFIATHLPAYLEDAGMAAEVGAAAIALIGLFNIAGSFYSGVLGGRYAKKYCLSAIYAARAAVIAAFIALPLSVASVLVFSALMGLLWLSTVPLTTGLVIQIFGLRYAATLVGVVFFSHQLGSFSGVWLGGFLYDATGAYDAVWWAGIALGLAAALIHWPIDDKRVPRLAAAG